MDLRDLPKFYLECALVDCTRGPRPVCVALLNEGGAILLNCYVVPKGAVVDWRTADTSLASFNDLLACNPVHLDQVLEYLQHYIPSESVLIGHGIEAIAASFGLLPGEDYAAAIDISDWFSVQLSRTLCQTFELAHILKILLGDDIPDHASGKRDPLLDAQYARMLYYSYKDVPYDHPIMHQARQTLFEGLGKEKRMADPALTVKLSCVPLGMSSADIRQQIVPRQVGHLVDAVKDVTFSPAASPPTGHGTIVFKSSRDVPQMLLRLHSNIDDWEWEVRREGQCYVHKRNGVRVEESEDISLKLYVHSIPDDWSEEDVPSRLVPEALRPHVVGVKQLQFRRTKDGARRLGRTHILFNSEWCVVEMYKLMQVMVDHWGWTTQQDGALLFQHKGDNVLVEAAEPITWEELMSAAEDAAAPPPPTANFVRAPGRAEGADQEEEGPDVEMDVEEASGDSDAPVSSREDEGGEQAQDDASAPAAMVVCA